MAQNFIERYGAAWNPESSDIEIEKYCIRKGGKWIGKDGNECGLGLFQHYKNLQSLYWPEKKWHRWNEIVLGELVRRRIIGIVGPANSAKTRESSDYALTLYSVYPKETTVLVSSTDARSLELRIWGELKKNWFRAKQRYPQFPGYMRSSKQMITTDSADMEAQDFRNGIVGIPCMISGQYVGLGKYVGIKNKYLILIGDELQFMPKTFVDAIANLNKNPNFQCAGMGNPKDRTDALGVICEPSDAIGGWDGLDQNEKTKVWPTRWENGVCIQLVGTDSPNFDVGPEDPVPFPFLIKRRDIESDLNFYGRDSLQFTMMNLGIFPKDSVSRRVITRMMCVQFGAMEQPTWSGKPILRLGALDAAYGNVGGDRCVFMELAMGYDIAGKQILAIIGNPIIVPINVKLDKISEDQIAEFVRDECIKRGIAPQNLGYDSTGRGTLGVSFARVWSPHINPIEFGGRASERMVSAERKVTCREYYSKFVSELWYSTRHAIESEQIRGLSEEVMNEGCMREWKIVQGNRIEVEPKDATKARMGRSPDLYDCFAAGVEMARRRGFVIEKAGNDRSRQDNMDWLRKLMDKQKHLNKSKELNHAA